MFSKASALRVVLVAAVFVGAGAAAQADQLQDIMQRKELRCGTFADVPPFAAPDPKTREMVGFDVDLCGAIAKELGVVAKITPLSVEARVPEVKLGHVDIAVANLAYTIGRASQIVGRARRPLTEDHHLGRPPTQAHRQGVHQVILAIQVPFDQR